MADVGLGFPRGAQPDQNRHHHRDNDDEQRGTQAD
jgi:hypothetical protein